MNKSTGFFLGAVLSAAAVFPAEWCSGYVDLVAATTAQVLVVGTTGACATFPDDFGNITVGQIKTLTELLPVSIVAPSGRNIDVIDVATGGGGTEFRTGVAAQDISFGGSNVGAERFKIDIANRRVAVASAASQTNFLTDDGVLEVQHLTATTPVVVLTGSFSGPQTADYLRIRDGRGSTPWLLIAANHSLTINGTAGQTAAILDLKNSSGATVVSAYVEGALRLTPTDSPPTCNAAFEGGLHAHDTTNTLRFCDGTSWKTVTLDP